jgi:type I restriction enzyme S subunit
LEISKADIEKLSFRVNVSLPEQRKIARILSTVDEVIGRTEAAIGKYQAIKQGMMHDLFTRGLDHNGKLRPRREEAPDLYHQTALGWLPKEWSLGSVASSCDIHNNLRLPISEENRSQMKGGYPYYGPTGILDYIDEFRVEGEFVLIGEDGDHFLKFDRQPMTILATGQFNVNNHAHILSGKIGCYTHWIHVWFIQRDITFFLTRQGAGRYKLNKKNLEQMPIALPPEQEQLEIYNRHNAMIRKEQSLNVSLKKYQYLKQALMQALLTGRKAVVL